MSELLGCRGKGTKGKLELAPEVQAIVDAVDRAAKLLPEEDKVNFTMYEQQEGGGWNQRGNDAPAQNPGSKVASHFYNSCERMPVAEE